MVNCTGAPDCTALHRDSCSKTASTCGSCLSGYSGILTQLIQISNNLHISSKQTFYHTRSNHVAEYLIVINFISPACIHLADGVMKQLRIIDINSSVHSFFDKL
jgi:hypothetical protein